MPPIPLVSHLSELASDYDAFVVDLWGVMHDGMTAFPEALDCLAKIADAGKKTILLSNAPRRADNVIGRNAELGIAPEMAAVVMSSGEEAWQHLKTRPDPWYAALGRACFHLGPARDLGVRDGLDYLFVDEVEDADFIFLTGALSFEDRTEDYLPLLERCLKRSLPMICANPDLEVIRGGNREICAGAIAAAYRDRGGQVRYHGKPDPEIYQTCLAAAGIGDCHRVLGIGDSLRTDIAGAQAAGLDSLFVVGGIHADDLQMTSQGHFNQDRLTELCQRRGVMPNGVTTHLQW
ncbi:MAG: TIGR01459 family HAD-type hydrolase [Pseudomonadota bacterium]